MPIRVSCSQCASILNAPDHLAGQSARCPKCGAVVTLPGAATEAPGAAVGGPVLPKPLPAAARGAPPAVQAFPPASPQPAGGPAARRSNSAVLFGVGGLAALLLLGVVLAIVFRSGSAPVAVNRFLQYLPDGADAYGEFKATQFLATPLGKSASDQWASLGDSGNAPPFALSDVAQVRFAGQIAEKQGLAMIETSRDLAVETLLGEAAGQAKRETIGGATVYFDPSGDTAAMAQVDARTILFGSPALVRQALSRKAPAKFSPELQRAIDQTDFSQTLAMTCTLDVQQLLSQAKMPVNPLIPMQALNAVQSATLSVNSAQDIRVGLALGCGTPAAADQLAALANGFLPMLTLMAGQVPPSAAEALSTIKVAAVGDRVQASATLPSSLIDQLLAQAGGSGGEPSNGPPMSPLATARAAAQRTQTSNNFKQVGLGLYSYLDAYSALPDVVPETDQAPPTLSWRVGILPFIEGKTLYDRFDSKQNWDAGPNQALLKERPKLFEHPGGKPVPPNTTSVLAVTGPGTMFSTRKPKLSDAPDGLSNTIWTVEAAPERAAPWTKPADFDFNPDQPREGLFGQRPGGFIAGFADGSVRIIKDTISDDALRALMSRNGMEPEVVLE